MRIERQEFRKHRQLTGKTGEEYSLSSVLSGDAPAGIFLSHEIVKPGRRSSGAHYHSETEEIIYVLEGELVAVEGEEEAILRKGDALFLQANSRLPHFLENRSGSDAHALVMRVKTARPDAVMGEPRSK